MRKFLSVFLLLMAVFLLVGCGDRTPGDIAAPKNVRIQDGVVSWDAVKDAESYIVMVGTRSFEVSGTSFDLKDVTIAVGTHVVVVLSVKGDEVSLPSSSLNYTVQGANLSSVYQQVLSAMGTMTGVAYTPEMTRGDFDSDDEFETYQTMNQLANAYSQAAVSSGMTEANAVGFVVRFMDVMEDEMEDVASFGDMFAIIDTFSDFGMDGYTFTYIMMNLADVAIDIQIDELQSNMAYYQSLISTAPVYSDFAVLVTVYNTLLSYALPSEVSLLQDIFELENQTHLNALYNLADYAYQIYWDGYIYWIPSGAENQLLAELLMDAYHDGNTEIISTLRSNDYYSAVNTIDYSSWDYFYYQRRIAETEDEIEMLEALKDTMEDDFEVMLNSVSLVVDYVADVYRSLPNTLAPILDKLVEGQELSMNEMFILKNAIVGALKENLPSVSDFEAMYIMTLTVSTSMTGMDLSGHLEHARMIAEIERASIDLMLEFIYSMSQQDLEEFLSIVDDMYTPGGYLYDPFYGYTRYQSPSVDEEKLIELIVFILSYLESFVDDHQAKVDTLNNVLTPQNKEILLDLMLNMALSMALLEVYDAEQEEMINAIFGLLLDETSNLVRVFDVFMEVGSVVASEFVSTEGVIIFEIMAMNDFDGTPFKITEQFEVILSHLASYMNPVFDVIDQEDVEALLYLVKLQYVIYFAQMSIIFDYDNEQDFVALIEDINDVFNQLVTPASQVIYNMMQIGRQALNTATDMDIADLIFDSAWSDDEELAAMIFAVMALDDVFTAQYRTLLNTTVSILFDDIFLNPDFLELMDAEASMIIDVQEMVEEAIADFFTELDIVSQYNFATLTEAQEIRIAEMLMNLFGLFMLVGSPAPY